jgi:CHAT domain-containing protein
VKEALRPGDVLLEYAGKTLKAPDDLPLGKGEVRPFGHPYYWAAFVLIGDPR